MRLTLSSIPFKAAVVVIIILFFMLAKSSQGDATFYDLCSPITCGNNTFTFPFSDSKTIGPGSRHCGLPGFQISCDDSGRATLGLSGTNYQVRALLPHRTQRIVTVVNTQLVKDLTSGYCDSLQNLTVVPASIANLSLPPWMLNLTLFQCDGKVMLTKEIQKAIMAKAKSRNSDRGGGEIYLWTNRTASGGVREAFAVVKVPVSDVLGLSVVVLNRSNGESERWDAVVNAMNEGFPLVWAEITDCNNCEDRGGRCALNGDLGKVVSFCKSACGNDVSTVKKSRDLAIAFAAGCSSVVLIVALVLIFKKKKLPMKKASCFRKDKQSTDERSNAEEFIKTYRSTLLTRYSYKEVKKMTNGFKEQLGKGGYGTVYKGMLLCGRAVAVKRLNRANNSQDFINEVATMGMIRHVNIIRLFGFCFEGSRRALIYEYMPNGSLGDLLRKQGQKQSLPLGMEKLLEIALGVALGIEYLERGCDSRILHLDIKPQNVLLDENLNPKISDFGSAKMYSRNKSFVTMTGTRGTVGFIAPEIFMRNLGNPSHKSDIYSYGMLLLEMVDVRKRQEVEESASSELYFPGWIYDKLNEERTQDSDDVTEEDASLLRKMVMVGLWCIQVNPKDRPGMTQVLEMLTGGVDSVPMPPKPLFFSPPRPQVVRGSTSSELDDGVAPLTFDSQEMQQV